MSEKHSDAGSRDAVRSVVQALIRTPRLDVASVNSIGFHSAAGTSSPAGVR